MPRFYVDQHPKSNRGHEVHQEGKCLNNPPPLERYDLGYHININTAIKEAKNNYIKVNACVSCSKKDHKKIT